MKGDSTMKNINTFSDFLKSRYQAVVLTPEETSKWMQEDETPVVGYRFDNPFTGLSLLSMADYPLLTDDQKKACFNNHITPFVNMMAIVYENADGALSLKTVNGISSVIIDLFTLWVHSRPDTEENL